MHFEEVDILIAGGGINGCAIARDAAGRGLSVTLCEKGDLASGTSSASTKLIHGGLRYLEHYEFGLVRKALRERSIIYRAAPHLVEPLRFVIPQARSSRPGWFVRAGLFVYDLLGASNIDKGTESVSLNRGPFRGLLQPGIRTGFAYSDCRVDDARLVIANAVDAHRHGASILTRTALVDCRPVRCSWDGLLQDTVTGQRSHISARFFIDATGSWPSPVSAAAIGHCGTKRLVKGSHIVTRRLYEQPQALLLQASDGRVVFTIPYEDDFTLIGTTDIPFHADPDSVRIMDEETEYLCTVVNNYLVNSITPQDVIHSYSGVRALRNDDLKSPERVSRDHSIVTRDCCGSKMISIVGGKITTARSLAEEVLSNLSPVLGGGQSWTERSQLPGGNFAIGELQSLAATLRAGFGFLTGELADRLARLYGTDAMHVLGHARCLADLGVHFGAGLYAKEVEYLLAHEWAVTAEDILWRRTKLGLRLRRDEVDRLIRFLNHQQNSASDPVSEARSLQ